jgi:hypothetical protein
MGKPFWCLLGRHKWRRRWSEDGQHYYKCERCGKEDDPASGIRGMGSPG